MTQLLCPSLDGVGQLEQHPAAILGRRVLPRLEGGCGGLDGPVDVLLATGLDAGNRLAVGGVLDRDGLPGGRIHPLAADELLVRLDLVDDGRHGGCPPGLSGNQMRAWEADCAPGSVSTRARARAARQPGCWVAGRPDPAVHSLT